MLPVETMLGRLGSRFTFHFPRPSEKCVYLGPLGKYYDRRWEFLLGVRAVKTSDSGQTEEYFYRLPYTSNANPFPEIEQEITMNSIRWKGRDRGRGIRGEFCLTAPFYPRDIKLCSAPFFYIEAEVMAPAEYSLELVIGLSEPSGEAKVSSGPDEISWLASYKMVPGHWGPREPSDSLSANKVYEAPLVLRTLSTSGQATYNPDSSLRLSGNRRVKATFALATFLPDPVLEARGELHRFKYLDYFKNIDEVFDYARQAENQIREKSASFDALFSESSLDYSTRNLLAFSFQSYIPNSWWCVPEKGGPDWYSVWEGNCTFHSTVDVEYNLAWFYLLLWPELLEMTLAEWRHYLKPAANGGAWLSHDIGALLGANQQAYFHEMEVEESANFILLAYTLWRYTARPQIPSDNAGVVAQLARYILDSATSGSGFPTEGTANTVDDASPAVQFGREQTYLAVKALGALHAAALLLETTGNQANLVEECRARTALIAKTLDERAWLSDHYAVCLDRTTDGLINPWTGQPLPPGELEGWNAYSLYTTNGLLYLLATDAPLPPGNLTRFRRDVLTARQASLTEYGCTHSSSDRSHIWISQNLHRDLTGAFLGIDPHDLPSRYWAYEQYENSVGRGGCFVDTYGPNHLRYYPRGITSLGLLAALPGAKFDRVAGKLSLSPTHVPLRLPLLALADWESGKIPEVEFKLENGRISRTFTHPELVTPFLGH